MKSVSELSGRYFPAGTSKSILAKLTRNALGVTVQTQEDTIFKNLVIDEISSRLANVPRKIRFNDGSIFECSDNDDVDALLNQEKSFFSRLSNVEGSLKLVLIATVACFVLIYGIYRYGLPAVASFAANVTPANVVEILDENTRKTVDSVLFSESKLSDERKAELTKIFDELVVLSGQTDPPLQLEFRDGGRLGPNAVALPGGTIILTDQLEAFAERDDELAGVFAHEIGHVEHKHSLRQIYRAVGIAFMISVIGGESEQIVEEVLGLAVALDSFRYTQAFEHEADEHSVEILVQTDYDPLAFIDLMDRIFEKYGLDKDDETSWLSTHPGNKDRREQVQRRIDALTK